MRTASVGGGGRPGLLFVGAYPPSRVGTRGISEDLAARLAAGGWRTLVTSRRRARALRPADQLATIVARRHQYGVAVVDVYSGAAFRWAEWAVAALRRLRRPVVLALHGGGLPDFARRAPARVAALLRAAAAVTAPSPYLAEFARPLRPDVRVLPNPVDVAAYAGRVRRGASPRLIWLRAFHEMYDPVLAVEVAARLAPDFPTLTLTMVGPDKDGTLARVRAAAEALGVAPRLTIRPGVPKHEVPAVLAAGDVFLNTTTVDNTPVSVLEAMATGLCVVSTDVGGVPRLVTHGRDGLLVAPRDSDAMATAARRVLTDATVAERLSQAALATAARMDWSAVLPTWEALLTAVASRDARPAQAAHA